MAQQGDMGPPASRKRSRDDMNREDIAQPSTQGKDDVNTDSQHIKPSDSQVERQEKEQIKQAPSSAAHTQQASQKPPSRRSSKAKSTDEDAASDDENDTSEVSISSDQSEPQDQIVQFDWDGLEMRFHDGVNKYSEQQREILQEFENLIRYFEAWAHAGSQKEIDRSFARLKTQITYVQHEEDELETKRQHYISVVEAFKSALRLLNQ